MQIENSVTLTNDLDLQRSKFTFLAHPINGRFQENFSSDSFETLQVNVPTLDPGIIVILLTLMNDLDLQRSKVNF